MVGNNAQGGNFQRGFAFYVQGFFGRVGQRGEQIRFKNILFVLHDHAQALQPHTGVYIILRQRLQGAVFLAVVAFKNNVPDFHKAPAVAGNVTVRVFAAFVAKVIINFAARAAGAGGAHGPKVVRFAQLKNTLFGHIFQPGVVGFFVARGDAAFVNAYIQFVRRNAQHARQVFPGPGDGLVFKIIAEREIAQHLKKSQVALGKAHAVNVGGAHAFLAGGGVFKAFVYAHKIGLKLHHARRSKQQGGVRMGDQRAGGNHRQAFGMKKLQKTVSDFCTFHIASCECALYGRARGYI